MGIKNLHQFLRKACPLIYNEQHISKLAYQKVAIDTSIYMCKFKTTCGKNWLDGFLQLITVLRENEIHPVFVYDTKFPPEKEQEKKNRTLARLKTKERVETIFRDWESYKGGFEETPAVFTEDRIPVERENMSVDLYEYLQKHYPQRTELSVAEVDRDIDHLLNTLLSIRSEDFETTRTLLNLLGVPWIHATGEAEATCAVLCRRGVVYAVLSEDTDVMCYKAPRFCHRLNVLGQTIVMIEYQDVLTRLEFTEDQFLDFCIMCGTDYNTNLAKIGPEKSYRLLKKFGSLEMIREQNSNLDMTDLPFLRVREIFLDEQSLDLPEIPFCGLPQLQPLLEFCFTHNCRFELPRLVKAFSTNPHLQFEDQEEKEK